MAVVVLGRQRDHLGAAVLAGELAARADDLRRRVAADEQRALGTGRQARPGGIGVAAGHGAHRDVGGHHILDCDPPRDLGLAPVGDFHFLSGRILQHKPLAVERNPDLLARPRVVAHKCGQLDPVLDDEEAGCDGPHE